MSEFSRFIAALTPCPDLAALQAFFAQLANEPPQATHITYAFRILTSEGLRERACDAGEPSGTAGRPILKHLPGGGALFRRHQARRRWAGT